MQRSLFALADEGIESKPLRRRTDPATSRVAAEQIQPALGATHAFVLEFCSSVEPRTAQEIAMRCWDANKSRTIETYRKRVKELSDLNRLSVVGQRKCCVTGKLARTWRRT